MTSQSRLKATIAFIDTASNDILRRQTSNTATDGATGELATGSDAANRSGSQRDLVIGETLAHDPRAALLLIPVQLFTGALDALWIAANGLTRAATRLKAIVTFTIDCLLISFLRYVRDMGVRRALLREHARRVEKRKHD